MVNEMHHGFVVTEEGTILVQVPDPDSRWGFCLTDNDQSWDGGLGCGTWDALDEDDERIDNETRERLEHLLEPNEKQLGDWRYLLRYLEGEEGEEEE